MEQPPPMPAFQPNYQDESHLKLLSVFHYVVGSLSLLGIIFIVGHFMMMKFIFDMAEADMKVNATAEASAISSGFESQSIEVEPQELPDTNLTAETPPATAVAPASSTAHSSPAEFPKEMIAVFVIFYAIGAFFCIAFAVMNVLSARFIARRKNRTFSFITAGLNCINFPFGTILGIFTIVVLSRVSVKMEYESKLPA